MEFFVLISYLSREIQVDLVRNFPVPPAPFRQVLDATEATAELVTPPPEAGRIMAHDRPLRAMTVGKRRPVALPGPGTCRGGSFE